MGSLTFNVVYEDAGEGWVYAHVPELPEVHTQGEGLEQARAMVRDAIAVVLEERRARGEEIPSTGRHDRGTRSRTSSSRDQERDGPRDLSPARHIDADRSTLGGASGRSRA